MLKDITFGQYLFQKSVIHSLDPCLKILLTIALIVMLFSTNNFIGVILTMLFVAVLFIIARQEKLYMH